MLLTLFIAASLIFTWVRSLRYGTFIPQDLAEFGFDVSQDGKRVVFSAMGRGTRDLYLLDRLSGEVTPLRTSNEREVEPCFTPDEKQVVFSSAKALQYPHHLWIMKADGSGARQLTDGDTTSDRDAVALPDGGIRCTRWHLLEWALKAASWQRPETYLLKQAFNPSGRNRPVATVNSEFVGEYGSSTNPPHFRNTVTILKISGTKQKTIHLPVQFFPNPVDQLRVAEHGAAIYVLETDVSTGESDSPADTAEISRFDIKSGEVTTVIDKTRFHHPLKAAR